MGRAAVIVLALALTLGGTAVDGFTTGVLAWGLRLGFYAGVVLAAINITWIVYDGKLSSGPATALLLGAAVALGMQSAAARAIDGTPSTTYMTGALTTLIEAVATGRARR